MRHKIIRINIIVLFVFIVSNLFYLQAIRGRYYFGLSRNNRIRVVPTEGTRGRIFDRNGVLLADNRMTFNVALIPQAIEDEEKLFGFLSQTLNKDRDELKKVFYNKKFTPFAPVVIVKNINKNKAFTLEENKFLFPGLLVQESYQRVYPQGKLYAHIVGYVGKINRAKIERLKQYGYSSQSVIGYSGVEEVYDHILRGEEGGLQIEVNSQGRQVRLLSLKQPSQGENITLTIDNNIQEIVYQALDGHNGAVVIMDVDSGEILSLVSAPSFDPNIFVDERKRRRARSLIAQSQSPLLNRAISGQYPPGSVFKVPVAFCALESTKVSQHSPFICPGYLESGNRRFGCPHVHGTQDLYQAVAHSCNVYFYRLALIVGADSIQKYAKMFGFGQKTGVDLPYETSGIVPGRLQRRIKSNRRWFQGDTLNLSIGQGETLATPLQTTWMMATIAASGRVEKPHLLGAIADKEAVVNSLKPIDIPKKNFLIMQDALRETVRSPTGTAHIVNIPGLEIAGKTGTAQTFGEKPSHSWFVGYNKSGKRKIAFSVFLEYGGSSYNACLKAQEILLKLKQANFI